MDARTMKGCRWAGGTMKVFGIIVVIKLFFAFKSNQFKGLVEAAMVLAIGLVCASIAFGLGWASGKAQPADGKDARVSPAVTQPQSGANANVGSAPSKWMVLEWLRGIAIALMVGGAVYTWVNQPGNHHRVAAVYSSVDFATATAEKLRVGLPRMVSSYQRLDSVTADPQRAVIFTYTMVGIPNLNMDAKSAVEFQKLLVAMSCGGSSSDSNNSLFAHGIAVRDRYLREDGYVVADVTIRPQDCPQKGSLAP